jgi:hypothetical protein
MTSPSDPLNSKKVEIWADVKFVSADPKIKPSFITTKKTKLQKIIKHLKELRRFFK